MNGAYSPFTTEIIDQRLRERRNEAAALRLAQRRNGEVMVDPSLTPSLATVRRRRRVFWHRHGVEC